VRTRGKRTVEGAGGPLACCNVHEMTRPSCLFYGAHVSGDAPKSSGKSGFSDGVGLRGCSFQESHKHMICLTDTHTHTRTKYIYKRSEAQMAKYPCRSLRNPET